MAPDRSTSVRGSHGGHGSGATCEGPDLDVRSRAGLPMYGRPCGRPIPPPDRWGPAKQVVGWAQHRAVPNFWSRRVSDDDRQALADQLQALSLPELVDVLRHVLPVRGNDEGRNGLTHR